MSEPKITVDLSRKPGETSAQHLNRIEKEYIRLPGQGETHKEAVIISADELARAQPTKEDLKRTAQMAKEAMDKLRPPKKKRR